MNNKRPEFTEEYTQKEKIRLILMMVVISGGVGFSSNAWLFPWIENFASTASCYIIFGYSGVTVGWYAIFVGIPLFLFLGIGIPVSWQGYKVIRDQQLPPKKSKAWKKTEILYGKKATSTVYWTWCFILAFFIPFLIWGYFQAFDITSKIDMSNLDYSQCPE